MCILCYILFQVSASHEVCYLVLPWSLQSSSSTVRCPLVNSHCSTHVQFRKQFIQNKFGYACKICDRLWFEGDLKYLIDHFSWWRPQCGLKASNIYLHSSSSICSSDVYRQQSGWCRYLYSILTHFLALTFPGFPFILTSFKEDILMIINYQILVVFKFISKCPFSLNNFIWYIHEYILYV